MKCIPSEVQYKLDVAKLEQLKLVQETAVNVIEGIETSTLIPRFYVTWVIDSLNGTRHLLDLITSNLYEKQTSLTKSPI